MAETPLQIPPFFEPDSFLPHIPISLYKNSFQTPFPLNFQKITVRFQKDYYSSVCYHLMTKWAHLMQIRIKNNPKLLTNEVIQQSYINAQKKIPVSSYMMRELCKNYLASFWQHGIEFASCLKMDTEYILQERNKIQKQESRIKENMALFSKNLKYIVFDWEGTLTEKIKGQYQLKEKAPQLLELLKKVFPQAQLILLSNKEHTLLQEEASQFKVAPFFNRICGGTTQKGANKPFFIAWELAMNGLPLSRSFEKRQKEILYIGDDKRVDEPFAHIFGANALIIDRTGNIPTLEYLQGALEDIYHINHLCQHKSSQDRAFLVNSNQKHRRKQ